jgi:hypothetical protein
MDTKSVIQLSKWFLLLELVGGGGKKELAKIRVCRT